MNTIYLLTTAGTLMGFGDLALAAWSRGGQAYFIVAGLLLNLLGIVAYAHTLSAENKGVATAMSLGLNILAITILSAAVFGQSLSVARTLGMFVLATSIIFIEVVG